MLSSDELQSLLLIEPESAKEAVRALSESDVNQIRLHNPDEWLAVLEHIVFSRKKKINHDTNFLRGLVCAYRALLDGTSFKKTWLKYHPLGTQPKKVILDNIDQWADLEFAFYSKGWDDRKNILEDFNLLNPIPEQSDFEKLLAEIKGRE